MNGRGGINRTRDQGPVDARNGARPAKRRPARFGPPRPDADREYVRIQNVKTHRPPATTGPAVPRLFVRPRPRNALQIREGLAAGALEKALLEEARVRERQFARRLYLTFFTRRGLTRLTHHVLGALLVLPLLGIVITPLTVADLRLTVILAATFGVAMALIQPRGITVGFLLAATGLTTFALAGLLVSLENVLNVLFSLLVYFGLGYALGITESIVRQGE
jgi:hypothetical protein